MIHLALLIILMLISGCASQTARISQAASSTSASAAAARGYLMAAEEELSSIEAQAKAVHQAIPFVSDDQSPIFSTLQYVSVAVVAAVIGALIYTYIPRK